MKSGNDDLRQDAVMQQLFGLINEVLAHSPATAKRRLRIVTYKVTSSDSALKLATANSRHLLTICCLSGKPFRQPIVVKVHWPFVPSEAFQRISA